jgi:hypothetical protein
MVVRVASPHPDSLPNSSPLPFPTGGTSTNHCTNNQSFNNTGNCNSIIGPVVLPILGQGTLTPCFNTPENGGRKLLQQINVPITVQCVNLLNNAQLLNIPNLNVGVIQVFAALLGGGGQTPSAIFYNSECSEMTLFLIVIPTDLTSRRALFREVYKSGVSQWKAFWISSGSPLVRLSTD